MLPTGCTLNLTDTKLLPAWLQCISIENSREGVDELKVYESSIDTSSKDSEASAKRGKERKQVTIEKGAMQRNATQCGLS